MDVKTTESPTTSQNITIVGGGTSGWITALYLQRYFSQANITVIESEHQGPIGVGEATVHSIRFLFAALDLNESELMRATNATLKLGILFRAWKKPSSFGEHEYFHPFEQQQQQGHYDIASEWLVGGHSQHTSYDKSVSISSTLAERYASPKNMRHGPYQGCVPYAYHIDAILLGQYLRQKGIERGIVHRIETVQRVNTANKHIESIVTEKNTYVADLFIDCTGFKGLLINSLQSDNWVSFEKELPCNSAVAIQSDYADGECPKPFTTATALKHGWAWQIDLANRQGNGYVYNDNEVTPEQAEAELRAFLGEHADSKSALHLKMKVGRCKQPWIGNCLAIGLAAGFIEPLESTGLHLINVGIRMFASHYSSETSDALRDNYNRKMAGVFDDLKQFIVLHYCLTDRDDTAFWRRAQRSAEHLPQLTSLLSVWQNKVCDFMDLAGGYTSTFNDENYRYVLYGMGYLPRLNLVVDETSNQALFQSINDLAHNAALKTQSHSDFIKALHNPPLFKNSSVSKTNNGAIHV